MKRSQWVGYEHAPLVWLSRGPRNRLWCMARSIGLNKGSGGRKRNLTIQLDEDIIQKAKELAVRKNTSVSGLVAQKIEEAVEADLRYQQAMERALEAMHNPVPRRVGKWTREELYEERLSRYDK